MQWVLIMFQEYENFRRRIWPMILDPLVRESLRLKALSEEKGSVYHPSVSLAVKISADVSQSFPSPPSTVDSELGASVVATHLKRRRLLKVSTFSRVCLRLTIA